MANLAMVANEELMPPAKITEFVTDPLKVNTAWAAS
jgi:hypothetical protein